MNIANLFWERFGPTVQEPNGIKTFSHHKNAITLKSHTEFEVWVFFFNYTDLHVADRKLYE